MQAVLRELLPSEAFRAWLSVVSSLAATGYRAEARRFRRGLDYTLASGEERGGEVMLDACLGLSWWADVPAGSDEEDALLEHGGWDCYLAAPDAEEDPETYQSALAKKAAHGADAEGEDEAATGKEATGNGEETAPEEATVAASNGADKGGPSISMGGVELEFDPDQFSDGDFDTDSEDGDDGPLLTHGASFNRFLLVLRDAGVMKFVKYLSAAAPGSRWDVNAEFEVGVMAEDSDEDGEGEEEKKE